MTMIAANLGTIDERLSVVLGFIPMVLVLACFTTCRSFISILMLTGKDPLQSKWYKIFYKYHAYYWSVFWVTFIAHVTTALLHTDLPKFGDPDAAIHLYILGAGLLSFIAMMTLGFSCRAFAGTYHLLTGKSITEGGIGSFYRHHEIYWLIFLMTIAVHLFFVHQHIGFWPPVMNMGG